MVAVRPSTELSLRRLGPEQTVASVCCGPRWVFQSYVLEILIFAKTTDAGD